MPLLPLLMAAAPIVSKIFGGAAQGSANQRGAENDQTGDQNRLLAQLYSTQQNATTNAVNAGSVEKLAQGNQDLDQRKLALTAPSVRASQSVRGSLMQNAQPATLSGVPDRIASRIPQISGGLTPSLLNADTRALGGEMTRKALIDQLKGDTFDPMTPTDFSKGILPAPKMEEYEKSSLLEKVLAGMGLGGSILGGIGEASDAYKAHRAKSYDGELGY